MNKQNVFLVALTMVLLLHGVVGCSPTPLASTGPSPDETSPATLSIPSASSMTSTPPPTQQPTSLGLILYESDYKSGRAIWQMNGDGTNKHVVVVGESDHGWPEWPSWFPNGQHFAYQWTSVQDDDTHQQSIWIADRDGTHQRQVSDLAECAGQWWQGEHALGFSTGTTATCDRYKHTQEDVQHFVYDLTIGEAREADLPSDIADYRIYRYSPSGNKVIAIKEQDQELFILDLRTEEKAVVFEIPDQDVGGEVADIVWSPKESKSAFSYCYGPGEVQEVFCNLYVVQADGQELSCLTNFEEQYIGRGSPVLLGSISWSPDEQWLAFLIGYSGESLAYLAIIPARGGPITHLWIAWRGGLKPVWSPDSTKIAFLSNVLFEKDVFANPYTDLGQWDIYTVDIYAQKIRRLTNDQSIERHIDWR